MAPPRSTKGSIRKEERAKGPVWIADNLERPGLRRKKACASFEEARRQLAAWLSESDEEQRAPAGDRAQTLERFVSDV